MKSMLRLLLVLGLSASCAAREPGRALRELTGSPARLVWIQQVEGDGDDPFCWADQHTIMALDTEDGRSERTLVGAVGNYHRPMIAPDGGAVVFSRFSTRKVYAVRWDGSGLREVADGYGLALWRDPATGETWLYYTTTGAEEWGQHHGHPVRRMKLDGSSGPELVWDRTAITVDNVQLSADGARACAQFPHPRAGYAVLPNRSWQPLSRGCWTSMAPDNSYWVWVFDGRHRNVTIHDPVNDRGWSVVLNSAPGLDGYEVYHPRWSTDRRFLALTGPYKVGTRGQNLIGAGGREVEVYVGRFNAECTEVEEWLRVTSNERGDFYPDLWIAPGPTAAPAAARPARPPVESWPLHREGLACVWDTARAADELDGPVGEVIPHGPLEGEGRAFWGPRHEMWLDGGRFTMPDPDGRLLAGLIRGGQLTVEALIAPADAESAGAIVSYEEPGGRAVFGFAEEEGTLLALIESAGGRRTLLPLGPLQARTRTHVMLTYADGRVAAWLDGRRVAERAMGPPDLAGVADGRWVFGSGGRWRGLLAGVAAWPRALPEDAVLDQAAWQARRWAGPAMPRRAVVSARLLEAPPAPSPAAIAPYRRALSAQVYDIEAVLEGGAATGRAAVAQWSVLDGRSVEEGRRPGEVYRLVLEPYEEHPQLESERLLMDAAWMTLPLYVETGRR